MKKLALIVLAFALVVSCKKGKESQDTGASQADMDLYHHTLTLQDQAYENYVTWSQTMDSLAAITKLQQFFMSDPVVTSATIGSQGVMVQYSNGFRGGVLLNTEDNDPDSSKFLDNYRKGPYGSSKLKSLVNNKKMIFLIPQRYDSDFIKAGDYISNYNQNLPKINYNNVEVYEDEQVNLDRFCHLKGYGIIQVYTHGIAWPNSDNIMDVYLMTGEVASDPETNRYIKEMHEGKIAYIKFPKNPAHGKSYYYITQDFITKHNDFSKDTSLFLGTFCYSYLGSWPDIQKSFAKGAYIGFDWVCNHDHGYKWSTSLIDDLCDITKPTPVNVEDWMGNSFPKSYLRKEPWWNPLEWHTVNIKYSGDPTLALWKSSSTHTTWVGYYVNVTQSSGQYPVKMQLTIYNSRNTTADFYDGTYLDHYAFSFTGNIDLSGSSITWNSPTPTIALTRFPQYCTLVKPLDAFHVVPPSSEK